MSPPTPVRETAAPAKDGRSSTQMNAADGPNGTAARAVVHELLRPLLALRRRWSH